MNHLDLKNFMLPGAVTLTFPKTGVVVITGDNGAGKSRVIEAIAYAVWGRTLRGTSPWIAESKESGTASVHSEDAMIVRTWHKGRKSVRASVDFEAIEGDTPSKTDELLTTTFGSFDVWRRTRVFSSSDAAMFSAATDAERKRLIEQILGLHIFDEAAGRLSQEARELGTTQARAMARADKARWVAQAATKSLADWLSAGRPQYTPPATTGAFFEPCKLQGPVLDVDALQAGLTRERTDSLEASDRELDVAARMALAELTSARRALALHEQGKCPTCSAPFAEGFVHDSEQAVAAAEEAHTRALAAVYEADQARIARCDAARARAMSIYDFEKARAYWDHVETAAYNFAARQAELDAAAQQAHIDQLNKWEIRRSRDELNKDEALALLDSAEDELAVLEQTVAELAAAQAVLGIRGLRSAVLSRALSGAEQLANVWLSRMAPGVRLSLNCDESKIELAIEADEHFGGGLGYKANSNGERRRVDIALLLALADIAAAGGAFERLGTIGNALFMDEVFDGLDADGRASVCSVVEELGKSRPVVVITHHDDLARGLNAAARYRVANGQIHQV